MVPWCLGVEKFFGSASTVLNPHTGREKLTLRAGWIITAPFRPEAFSPIGAGTPGGRAMDGMASGAADRPRAHAM